MLSSPNPEGPVQPQDVTDLRDIPLGDDNNSDLQLDDQGATLTTNINGVPVNVRLDRNGLNVQPSGKLPTPTPGPVTPAPLPPDRAPARNTGPPPGH